jgi:Domain of unknown function (DUF1707)
MPERPCSPPGDSSLRNSRSGVSPPGVSPTGDSQSGVSATGDSRAMPGPPRVLADDTSRDRLLGLLREHYARGTINDVELDRRTEMVLTAQFSDQAAAAVADLPVLAGPGPAGSGPSGQGLAGPGKGTARRERRRHAQTVVPQAGWVPTAERFRDPTSRAIMRVWIDPADDSRHYVPEPDP